MAEIRLEGVTVTYPPGNLRYLPAPGHLRRAPASGVDRAFAERQVAQREALPPREGPVTALDGLDLVIRDGETLAIVGPSGSGKSTLLRVIAGLEPVQAGRVLMDGQDMAGVKPGDRGIGMVFQNYALYPHMKGEGNLSFFFRVHRRPTEEELERIRITSEIMGLGFDTLLPRAPRTLSGGQQQRVAIARCIVRDPSLFLFDEPLSSLDAKLRAQTRVEIKRLLRRFAITSVYVTHDQTEAIALGDRVAVMRDGRMEQVDSYPTLHALPANAFVAGFVGIPVMNLVEGYTAEGGRLSGPLGPAVLPAWRYRVTRGQPMTLGFRGAAAGLAGEPAGGEDGLSFDGLVIACEPDYARHEQLVHVEAGGQRLTVTAPLEADAAPGRTVRVRVPAGAIYLFDTATGARVHP